MTSREMNTVPADPKQWTKEDVGSWLTEKGFQQYAEVFIEHEITGSMLLQLDRESLAELIPILAHVLTVHEHIQELKGLESPRHIGEGVISGFGGFASKLFDGFTHLVNDPLEGATRDGATGFVKGMASGIVGAIQKPAEGVSVLAKQVGTGLRATPDAIFGTGSGLLEGLPEDGRSELREIEALKPSFLQADANAKPAHVGEGLMFGLKSLGSGVYDGVTGLVTEPLKAAISSTGQSTPQTGVLFAKGFARGIAGVICKPAAGALDLASNAMSGLIATPGAVIAAAKEGPSLTETPTMQRLSNLREGLNQRVQAIAERVSEDGEAARRHDATSS